MPRQKVGYKTKKRQFHGNRYVRRDSAGPDSDLANNLQTPHQGSSQTRTPERSASSKKIQFDKYDDFISEGSGSYIFDLSIISDAIKSFVCCQFCGGKDCIEMGIVDNDRYGLAVGVQMKCSTCTKSSKFYSSKKTNGKFEVNLKLAYAMRTIGKGFSAAKMFSALLDLPQPTQKYHEYTKELLEAVEKCAEESMTAATEEAVVENNNSRDLAVCLDGSWQRRGHKSLNGFVSVISFDTGKILDVSVYSKYCQICQTSKDKEVLDRHSCTKNYEGNSGGMEVAGALKVFENSVHRNVRFVKYLGDGDSKGFMKVIEGKPYGDDVLIEKLECVGHVGKRMGTRLRNLKKEMKGQKLADGRVLGGRNRLTDVQIDKCQTYYGLAIRRAGSDLEQMKKNVWATYFHRISTDESPSHGLCPSGEDSWCKFNKSKALNREYQHKNSLPVPVMNAVKSIYQDLADPALLSKCLHGRTQNNNESFNNVVWSKLPKNVFVRLSTLRLGVLDAVLTFNDGNSSKLNIYKKLGLKLCAQSVKVIQDIDILRIKKAQKAMENITKEARMEKRKRKLLEEEDNSEEDPYYGAGRF